MSINANYFGGMQNTMNDAPFMGHSYSYALKHQRKGDVKMSASGGGGDNVTENGDDGDEN